MKKESSKKEEKDSEEMDYKKKFPDYKPKISMDTIYDYNKTPKEVIELLEKIGKPSLEKLEKILELLKKYQKETNNNPGKYVQGNVALGADPEEYIPSKSELLVSELGKMIQVILDQHSKKEINDWKQKEDIPSQTITFTEITFRHTDVMGSGRFFYAEKNPVKIDLRL
jgi:hypothetical protein